MNIRTGYTWFWTGFRGT